MSQARRGGVRRAIARGFHFRNSVVQGEQVGNDIADWELKQYFQPVESWREAIAVEWPASVRATLAASLCS